ncbi:MAG: gamma-glutamylcyclotransferase [Gammaproteobacteria bacterium]|nr:gamma-glutamylcyclotransferase [Gammaproteobacteria bacterium]
MPLVFSYGTLQQESVQLATFGRLLDGRADALCGFVAAKVPITDAAQVAASGLSYYDNAEHDGNPNHQVEGIAFNLNDEEISVADSYEQAADYVRIEATLASGKRAWVYVHRPSAPSSESSVRVGVPRGPKHVGWAVLLVGPESNSILSIWVSADESE